MTHRIVANLDLEHRLGSGRPLSRQARAHLALAGTLLRVFAHAGDELWLPGPVPADAIPREGGLPEAILRHGPPTSRPDRWVWSPEPESADLDDPVRILLSRRWSHDLRVDEGWALPGEAWIEDLDMLIAATADWPANRGWVLKAPYSAAGRDRHFGQGPAGAQDARVFFENFGAGLLESWLTRTSDHGGLGRVGSLGVEVVGVHDQEVSAAGAFRGIVTPSLAAPGIQHAVSDAVKRVGQRLAESGYRGPFGVDAFVESDREDREDRIVVCEVNVRHSFGFVARAWRELLIERERITAGAARLLFSKTAIEDGVPLIASRGELELHASMASVAGPS